ncbi:hypothetical protein [Wansuia hejianensis]|uniref:Uncharacterized protein n=1 Tax=Wansuia hejianensis TaxID=2763667 RepID=A0A7G9G8V6_9FIRM|nr:hypothetical protein [Wansuia hejianensis]QNM07238.1 hypothetical protein H9Q79_09760 [Wansuia hejianensis]
MNKKRLFTVLITLIFTLGLFTAPINASPLNEQHIVNREITYYSDGYYLETITYESNISTYGSSSKTGTKTATYYNGSTPLWYVSVTGSFTYSGHSSLCTGASASSGSYSSDWKIIDTTSSYSRNTATGVAIGRLYGAGTPLKTIPLSVILTCDIDGNLT